MSAHSVPLDRVMAPDNVRLSEGAGSVVSKALAGLGLLLIIATALGGIFGDAKAAKLAIHAYHTGFILVLAAPLGALATVMILHQTNAGWSATVRRQFENIMSLVWVPALLFVGGVIMQLILMGRGEQSVFLFKWMDSSYTAGDVLYDIKQPFLNIPFFYVRAAIYFAVWLILSFVLFNYSTRQDHDGDRWHTARARKVSAVGLLLFAFTTAFAAFDWVMTLDFHWFSTMFGVWYFAGAMVTALTLATLILLTLRYLGRLHVAFTPEHLHDLSKLVFGFMVFWAYIAFSQYFLIWYANIPEETAFFMHRRPEGTIWRTLSWVIPIGHFIIPFVWLMARPVRRNAAAIAIACLWLLAMRVIEVFWYIRPEATAYAADGSKAILPIGALDVAGVAGPVLLFVGLLIGKVARGPLIPLKDPRLPEALHHKNYV